jgi:hypothetical protein
MYIVPMIIAALLVLPITLANAHMFNKPGSRIEECEVSKVL